MYNFNYSFHKYIEKTINLVPLKEKDTNFDKDEKTIVEQFGYLQRYIDSDSEHFKNLNTGFLEFDRYSDIHPYKFNTIYLKENKYINASSMNIYNENYFISTQGPKKETIEDFWTMIDEYNVNIIVMICKEIEDGVEKCTNYWNEENEMTMYKIVIEKETIKDNYVIREIKLINNSTKKEKNVIQLHFNGWSDHGVPDVSDGKIFDSFNEMIELVDNYRENKPIVVHCSAGVGRTGTFISMYVLNKEIKKQIEENAKEIQFSIFNLVRKLKEMRLYSVQTQQQYNFIYQYVSYFLINNNN